MKSHNKLKITCTICVSKFWTNAKLAQLTHTRKMSLGNREIHVQFAMNIFHSDTKIITHPCRMCNVSFDTKTELEQHMHVNHNKYIFM